MMHGRLTTEQLTRAIDLAGSIYARHAAGCCLHIVLDDGNYEDHHVAYCRKYAIENGCDECLELSDLLLLMSPSQRHKLSTGGYGGFMASRNAVPILSPVAPNQIGRPAASEDPFVFMSPPVDLSRFQQETALLRQRLASREPITAPPPEPGAASLPPAHPSHR